jgi:hypothetical protein
MVFAQGNAFRKSGLVVVVVDPRGAPSVVRGRRGVLRIKDLRFRRDFMRRE